MASSQEQEDSVMHDADDHSSSPRNSPPTPSDALPSTTDKTAKIHIEDLFDDDDDSDSSLLNSSTPQKDLPSSPPLAPVQSKPSESYSDPEIMTAFYQRLYPFKHLFTWLNYSLKPSTSFFNREFAFTLPGDIYLRYQSFTDADALRRDILRLNPSRFEIGPVYSTNPRDRKSLRKASSFKPVAKELCFDIDLTDYDDVRTCCDAANICNKCWTFITMAIRVVDAALREDFGLKHILWVYSGRRGAHAWISDKSIRGMDDARRKAIAGYLEVIKGGSQSGKKVNVRRPLHPHLTRSLDVLSEYFSRDILGVQDPWSTNERAERLLALLPDRSLVDALRKKWAAAPGRSSASRWADIDAVAKTGVSKSLDTRDLLEAKKDVILEYTYPRLDIEVSKKLNHLLKAPFVVHPKTGRVCVPIDLERLEEFDPLSVPKVTDLLREIDEWKGDDMDMDGDGSGEGKDREKVPDYAKTSLKPYVELFARHVAAIARDERDELGRSEEGDPMEF